MLNFVRDVQQLSAGVARLRKCAASASSPFASPFFRGSKLKRKLMRHGVCALPKFVPTHVTNFGGTTSRSVARRNHACA